MAKSWSWTLVLHAPVADQGSVDVPTPGYDATLTDQDSTELAIGNDVVAVPEQATVTFAGATATVVNLTGGEWAIDESVYIYVKAKDFTGEGAGDALAEMQAQIDANASAITALDARVSALEAAANAARSVPLTPTKSSPPKK